jgi:hypothetical protein
VTPAGREVSMDKTYNVPFLCLRLEDIDALPLQNRLSEIGRLASASEVPHP